MDADQPTAPVAVLRFGDPPARRQSLIEISVQFQADVEGFTDRGIRPLGLTLHRGLGAGRLLLGDGGRRGGAKQQERQSQRPRQEGQTAPGAEGEWKAVDHGIVLKQNTTVSRA